MKKETLISALEIVEKNDTLTLVDLMNQKHSSADSIEVMLYLIKMDLLSDTGDGVFAVRKNKYQVKRVKMRNGLLTHKLSLADAKTIAPQFTCVDIELLIKASQEVVQFSDLSDGEKEAIEKMYDYNIADVIDDEIFCKLNNADLLALQLAVQKKESIARRAQKKERRKAYREQMRKLEEQQAAKAAEDEAEKKEEESTEQKEEQSDSLDMPDFSAISKRAGTLIGDKKPDKEKKDIFLYSFQGVLGEPVKGEMDSDRDLVELIMRVSRIANERRVEVFGTEMLPFDIVRASKSDVDKLAAIYVKPGGEQEQRKLVWKKPLKEQIEDIIFAHQCLGFPVEFTLVVGSESTGN